MTEVGMKHCEACAFWEAPPEGEAWGRCIRGDSLFGGPVDPETLAVAHDADKLKARINTKSNFGCVMHAG